MREFCLEPELEGKFPVLWSSQLCPTGHNSMAALAALFLDPKDNKSENDLGWKGP